VILQVVLQKYAESRARLLLALVSNRSRENCQAPTVTEVTGLNFMQLRILIDN